MLNNAVSATAGSATLIAGVGGIGVDVSEGGAGGDGGTITTSSTLTANGLTISGEVGGAGGSKAGGAGGSVFVGYTTTSTGGNIAITSGDAGAAGSFAPGGVGGSVIFTENSTLVGDGANSTLKITAGAGVDASSNTDGIAGANITMNWGEGASISGMMQTQITSGSGGANNGNKAGGAGGSVLLNSISLAADQMLILATGKANKVGTHGDNGEIVLGYNGGVIAADIITVNSTYSLITLGTITDHEGGNNSILNLSSPVQGSGVLLRESFGGALNFAMPSNRVTLADGVNLTGSTATTGLGNLYIEGDSTISGTIGSTTDGVVSWFGTIFGGTKTLALNGDVYTSSLRFGGTLEIGESAAVSVSEDFDFISSDTSSITVADGGSLSYYKFEQSNANNTITFTGSGSLINTADRIRGSEISVVAGAYDTTLNLQGFINAPNININANEGKTEFGTIALTAATIAGINTTGSVGGHVVVHGGDSAIGQIGLLADGGSIPYHITDIAFVDNAPSSLAVDTLFTVGPRTEDYARGGIPIVTTAHDNIGTITINKSYTFNGDIGAPDKRLASIITQADTFWPGAQNIYAYNVVPSETGLNIHMGGAAVFGVVGSSAAPYALITMSGWQDQGDNPQAYNLSTMENAGNMYATSFTMYDTVTSYADHANIIAAEAHGSNPGNINLNDGAIFNSTHGDVFASVTNSRGGGANLNISTTQVGSGFNAGTITDATTTTTFTDGGFYQFIPTNSITDAIFAGPVFAPAAPTFDITQGSDLTFGNGIVAASGLTLNLGDNAVIFNADSVIEGDVVINVSSTLGNLAIAADKVLDMSTANITLNVYSPLQGGGTTIPIIELLNSNSSVIKIDPSRINVVSQGSEWFFFDNNLTRNPPYFSSPPSPKITTTPNGFQITQSQVKALIKKISNATTPNTETVALLSQLKNVTISSNEQVKAFVGLVSDVDRYLGTTAAAEVVATTVSNNAATTSANNQIVANTRSVFDQSVVSSLANIGAHVDTVAQVEVEGAAAGDHDSHKLGVWFTAFGGDAKQKALEDTPGYKSVIFGGSLGVDTKLNDNAIVGIAATYADSKLKYKGNRSGDKNKTALWMGSLYGMYDFGNNLFAHAVASYASGRNDNGELRTVGVNAASHAQIKALAKSKYNSQTISTEVGLGYKYRALDGALTITPSAAVQYSNSTDGGYTETGAASRNNAVKSRKYDQYTGILGLSTYLELEYRDLSITPEVHGSINQRISGKVPVSVSQITGFDHIATTSQLVKRSYITGATLSVQSGITKITAGCDFSLSKKYLGTQGSLKIRVDL